MKIWILKMMEKWVNFTLNVGKKRYFCRKLNQKNKVKTINVGLFQKNLKNEMFKSHFKVILHISLI
jgi:hypothetical protein